LQAAAGTALLIDFGSTFTKVRLVDVSTGDLLGTAQAPSTPDTNIVEGLTAARAALGSRVGDRPDLIRACSSAAGGLRMVAVGLVPSLTAEAARRAVLGAGARLIQSYAGQLTRAEIAEIAESAPDILLLAGGIDGGDRRVVLGNADLLAAARLDCHVVMAGNRNAADDVQEAFAAVGQPVSVCENVLPELDRLNVEPAREAIRDVFMARIVHAKGLDEATELVGNVVMPTPMAVLKGAELIARSVDGQDGIGDLLLVDVGGATTDVHSVGSGAPTREGVLVRGLPEPHAKRTVEGDLGIRANAPAIVAHIERDGSLSQHVTPQIRAELGPWASMLASPVGVHSVDQSRPELDATLAWAATRIATRRHAGVLADVATTRGVVQLQTGKDLTRFAVIGTGGVFAHVGGVEAVLSAAGLDHSHPELLLPDSTRCFVDRSYCFAAAGLLADIAPAAAHRLLMSSLEEVG
jgi:uncharacterized protein (TIGR01319 family)